MADVTFRAVLLLLFIPFSSQEARLRALMRAYVRRIIDKLCLRPACNAAKDGCSENLLNSSSAIFNANFAVFGNFRRLPKTFLLLI